MAVSRKYNATPQPSILSTDPFTDYDMTGIKHKNPVKAIILSAGQGRRLLSLTQNTPKCLLPVSGKPIIEWQIDALLSAGVAEINVVTGFQSTRVETLLQQRY